MFSVYFRGKKIKLTSRPKRLQEKIFSQLFEQAEIAHYNKEEYLQYEESLKHYRDIKNIKDTAFGDGHKEGKKEGKAENQIEIIINLRKAGAEIELISKGTGLNIEEVKEILEENELK